MRLSKDPEARIRQLKGAEEAANPTPEQIAEGEKLAREGWKQMSRKYRSIARVPPGYTPLEALQEVDPEGAARLIAEYKQLLQNRASDIFRMKHGDHPLLKDNQLELDIGTFAAYRKAGGSAW